MLTGERAAWCVLPTPSPSSPPRLVPQLSLKERSSGGTRTAALTFVAGVNESLCCFDLRAEADCLALQSFCGKAGAAFTSSVAEELRVKRGDHI